MKPNFENENPQNIQINYINIFNNCQFFNVPTFEKSETSAAKSKRNRARRRRRAKGLS